MLFQGCATNQRPPNRGATDQLSPRIVANRNTSLNIHPNGYHTAKLYLNLKYQTGTLMNLMLLPGILKYTLKNVKLNRTAASIKLMLIVPFIN